ncbi:uncharacterized protein [Miscanthus floridulus]|uniref:uncharacterized protein n=1 Tax=Miscanthus floridulus TaxID=154761 RepID=UPI00345A5A90
MVVLTEEFHGLSLKRKGAHEPGLFDDAGAGADDRSSGFSPSCRATKMRRLACPGGPRDGDDQAAVGGAPTPAWEDDVTMGEGDAAAAAPSPSPGAADNDDERAVVVYGDGVGSSRRIDAPRLRADWIRAMLREADSRTVRELLAGAALERGCEPDLALAVVPWVAPTPAAEEEVATEEASDGAAAMDVEGDVGQESRPWTWTGQGQAYGAVAGEGLVYRWPQHCWAAPVVAQASPVMWSW